MHASSRNQYGFTLLELLVTMLIAVMAITVVAPRFSALIPGVEIKGEAQKVAALLRFARSRAIAEGDVISVARLEEPAAIEVTGSSKLYTWPSSITMELTRELSQTDDEPEIRFYPDGSSSGGVVSLKSEGLSYTVAVDWLTGRVIIND
ncbi:GspH/FimT family pseudopilin [Pontibacterium granulatum]|uniref:GspH/FimT family pseudopilin n=1 Tax=Pontibacterium granulatum TaxID=2036029 RepID=UPI00249B835C|nr:GspH/FimT family pseudopilin [Pontibacterium granulatum]MDI3324152.1 GspH/FimT family pseudopilin [Pontibacterium granulatum]